MKGVWGIHIDSCFSSIVLDIFIADINVSSNKVECENFLVGIHQRKIRDISTFIYFFIHYLLACAREIQLHNANVPLVHIF